jgi:hypothetical protein
MPGAGIANSLAKQLQIIGGGNCAPAVALNRTFSRQTANF